uniref:Longin domain-containing protein n=1 Tax=Aegilops tauschii subsp. strangulata TaxID=200361 RepID=A0A453M0X3_AEGTS
MFLFHLNQICSYIIEGRVCYLTMCDRSYPKKLAFQYLEDLKNEFERVNGSQIETAARPYAFIKFGMIFKSLLQLQASFSFTLSKLSLTLSLSSSTG